EARLRWEEALEIARETGQARYVATLLSNLAVIASEQGDLEGASKLFSDSLATHRRNDDKVSIAYTLMNSADVLKSQHRFTEARERLEESRRIFIELGHKQEMGL